MSQTFFQNKKITIIPRLKEKDVYINIEGEEDRPIYNLGEGVQAIIIQDCLLKCVSSKIKLGLGS
ncbi:hypothetical protein, partial [Empedobacter sp.]|uniref:hypothetical protein n=1 Tax=Empedobacter sp. TaxID=1927715 RepID=UPI0028A14338